MTPTYIAARTHWAVRVGLDVPGGDAMAENILEALCRVGFCLDTTPGAEHIRFNTREGAVRLRGFMVLHGREAV